MGRAWYEDGRLEHKANTFTDFIACAEHLIAEGYDRPTSSAGRGGSAGGLLMGAVANLRPDLFAAIVAEVPFVDCLTTMLDASLPLTVTEWEEWGNPGSERRTTSCCRTRRTTTSRRRPTPPCSSPPASTTPRAVLGAGEVGGQAPHHHDR